MAPPIVVPSLCLGDYSFTNDGDKFFSVAERPYIIENCTLPSCVVHNDPLSWQVSLAAPNATVRLSYNKTWGLGTPLYFVSDTNDENAYFRLLPSKCCGFPSALTLRRFSPTPVLDVVANYQPTTEVGWYSFQKSASDFHTDDLFTVLDGGPCNGTALRAIKHPHDTTDAIYLALGVLITALIFVLGCCCFARAFRVCTEAPIHPPRVAGKWRTRQVGNNREGESDAASSRLIN